MKPENILPENIQSLQPYEAGKTIAEVQREYHPKRISKLASNENRLGCSKQVPRAVNQAMNVIQDYPNPIATDLRKKIANLHHVSESEVLLAAGSESIIAILCRTFFKNDENTVTAEATFVGFFVQAGIQGVELKKIPLNENYKFDVEAILDAVDKKTKMVYIANPNNPTGTYINKEEYKMLCSELPGDVLLIMDEAYHEYAGAAQDYPDSLLYRQQNVITLRTFSKAYGLAGLRIGYAIADDRLINEMMKTKLTFEPSALAQAAAYAALDDQVFIEKSIQTVNEGRQRLYDFFDEHRVNYIPSISNSVMMILDDTAQAKSFTQSMLEQGVILRRVHAFGLPNCIRITIGTDREMSHFEESYLNTVHASQPK
ncbi:MAG: histidinol-phosphate transaminase [Balneolaceae bacterium]|nr:histidinol-phosphate transaminase [Balneolaceae bacterium]